MLGAMVVRVIERYVWDLWAKIHHHPTATRNNFITQIDFHYYKRITIILLSKLLSFQFFSKRVVLVSALGFGARLLGTIGEAWYRTLDASFSWPQWPLRPLGCASWEPDTTSKWDWYYLYRNFYPEATSSLSIFGTVSIAHYRYSLLVTFAAAEEGARRLTGRCSGLSTRRWV